MKYQGALAKRRPYKSPPSILFATEDEWKMWLATERNAQHQVLLALLKHYGLKDGDWYGLAIALAGDHVPKMTRMGRPGHPTKWDDVRRANLRIAVDDMVANVQSTGRQMPVNSAFTRIAKQSPWKELLGNSKNPTNALRAQYKAASPQLAEAIRNNPQGVADVAVVDKVLDTAIREFASSHGIKP